MVSNKWIKIRKKRASFTKLVLVLRIALNSYALPRYFSDGDRTLPYVCVCYDKIIHTYENYPLYANVKFA